MIDETLWNGLIYGTRASIKTVSKKSHLLFIMKPPASLILCASSSLEGLWSCDIGTGLKFL